MDSKSDPVLKHYLQAVHNYKFFCEVHSKLPDAFYDWKITVLFYTALHLLRGLMIERGVDPGENHNALRKAIDPGNNNATRPVKKHCYNSYIILYNTSLEVRYSGFLDPKSRDKYLKKKYVKCHEALKSVDTYMKSQGFDSLIPLQEEFDFGGE